MKEVESGPVDEISYDHFVQLLADGYAHVDELGAVAPSGAGAERTADFFQQGHAFGIVIQKGVQGRIQKTDHIPDRMGEVVRPPTELVCIVQAVGNQACLE
jgi:hypothetical protein